MTQSKWIAAVALIVFVFVLVGATVYSVDERERAIVIKFGQVIRYDDKPGLHWKTPFVDSVRYFDSRILNLDAEPRPFLTKEKKNVLVDSFVKWRIFDPLKFYVTVGGSEQNARTRLAQLINSGLRDEFGKRNVREVISGDRRKIMEILSLTADKEAREYGIQVVDVRIQRVELTEGVSESVYQRMKAI